MAATSPNPTPNPDLTADANPQSKTHVANPHYFYVHPPEIPPEISSLLQHYSRIPPASQPQHILSLRNKAYQTHPYPCLGRFRFLNLDLSSSPLYRSYVLPLLTGEETSVKRGGRTVTEEGVDDAVFLDLGTCLGQDLRKLMFDGVRVERVWGSDVVAEFVDYGFELFCDGDRVSRDRFLVPGNALLGDGEDGDRLRELDERVDVVHATAVFHLFDLEDQKRVADRCLRLLRRDRKRPGLVLGGQAGNAVAGESARANGSKCYRHNLESWREMWEGVVRQTPRWKNEIKRVEVDGYLEDKGSIYGHLQSRRKGENEAEAQQDMFTGEPGGGTRWHVFWVWVDFDQHA